MLKEEKKVEWALKGKENEGEGTLKEVKEEGTLNEEKEVEGSFKEEQSLTLFCLDEISF